MIRDLRIDQTSRLHCLVRVIELLAIYIQLTTLSLTDVSQQAYKRQVIKTLDYDTTVYKPFFSTNPFIIRIYIRVNTLFYYFRFYIRVNHVLNTTYNQ